jgi:hypothetical protein
LASLYIDGKGIRRDLLAARDLLATITSARYMDEKNKLLGVIDSLEKQHIAQLGNKAKGSDCVIS